MGHFLSRKGTSPRLEKSRPRRRGCPLSGKLPLPRHAPPRSRSCFLRGPCMLCFLVHNASPPANAEPQSPAARRHSPLLFAALKAPEERAARRRPRLPPAAPWEARGRRCRHLLLSGLLFSPPPPPPPPSSARRGFLGPALESGEAQPEMVCKRKGVGLAACPPRKQPRCAAASAATAGATGAAATGAESSPPPLPPPPPEAAPAASRCPAGALPEQHACPLPCASESRGARGGSPKDPAAENGEEKGLSPEGSPSQLPEFGGKEKHEPREPDCEEPPENPGDCCREPPPPSPDINQLPPSILLKLTQQNKQTQRRRYCFV